MEKQRKFRGEFKTFKVMIKGTKLQIDIKNLLYLAVGAILLKFTEATSFMTSRIVFEYPGETSQIANDNKRLSKVLEDFDKNFYEKIYQEIDARKINI